MSHPDMDQETKDFIAATDGAHTVVSAFVKSVPRWLAILTLRRVARVLVAQFDHNSSLANAMIKSARSQGASECRVLENHCCSLAAQIIVRGAM
jgi:hypothetical protein